MFSEEIQYNFEHQIPFVVYRKPEQQEVFYLKEENGNQKFVFFSFDQQQKLHIAYHTKKQVQTDECWGRVILPETPLQHLATTQEHYQEKIQKVIEYIQEGKVEKIVFSRPILIPQHIDLLNTYRAFLTHYTHAFCYLWYHPRSGVWMGATPEILTHIQGKELKTMSLAGTKTTDQEWTIKEQKEQKVVSDYIIHQITPLVTSCEVSEVKTVQSGAIQHLQTEITAMLQSKNYTQIIEKIHPTPAVCGIPTVVARTYIQQNEGYDRTFYTGFLGEWNEEAVELYVNLRCAQVTASQIQLYVGGGINALSNPQKEWEETEWKAQTIKSQLVY